jgi:hypothetical protein
MVIKIRVDKNKSNIFKSPNKMYANEEEVAHMHSHHHQRSYHEEEMDEEDEENAGVTA